MIFESLPYSQKKKYNLGMFSKETINKSNFVTCFYIKLLKSTFSELGGQQIYLLFIPTAIMG